MNIFNIFLNTSRKITLELNEDMRRNRNDSIRNRLFYAYKENVLIDLELILLLGKSKKSIRKPLKLFLINNWNLIKRSFLSYTALPNDNLLQSEKNSLYAHLMELCRKLTFSSVDGIGHEENASDDAYLAILVFSHYYSGINNNEKEKIPPLLKDEIVDILPSMNEGDSYCSQTNRV